MYSVDTPKIRGKMSERGYTITSLAKQIGINRNTLSSYLEAPENIPYGKLSIMAELLCDTPDGEKLLEADTILLAAGMKADRATVEQFYNAAPRVYEVGDCIKAGRVLEAVTLGHYRALDV